MSNQMSFGEVEYLIGKCHNKKRYSTDDHIKSRYVLYFMMLFSMNEMISQRKERNRKQNVVLSKYI